MTVRAHTPTLLAGAVRKVLPTETAAMKVNLAITPLTTTRVSILPIITSSNNRCKPRKNCKPKKASNPPLCILTMKDQQKAILTKNIVIWEACRSSPNPEYHIKLTQWFELPRTN